jgi:hypothetical protein
MNNNELMSASDLLRKAYDLTIAKARVLYPIVAIMFGGWAVIWALGIVSVVGGGALAGLAGLIAGGAVGLIAFLAFIFIAVWCQVAMYQAIVSDTGFSGAFAMSKNKVGKYFWTSFLSGLIVGLGFILLLVPGIIFLVWYAFAPIILVAEGISGMAALNQSKNYVKGRWGDVAWRLFFVILGLIIIQIVIGLLFRGSLGGIISAILNFLYVPFITVYEYLLYKNLKETMPSAVADVVPTPAIPPMPQ